MVAAKYLDPADGAWKPLPVPPHVHPGQGRIPGEVIAYAGTTPPAGWLVCDGAEVKAADYPLLAQVLGSWGPGGVTFLPDLRDRFVLGVGGTHTTIGERVGSTSHDHAGIPLPPHTHSAAQLGTHVHSVPASGTTSDAHTHTVNPDAVTSGAGGSHGHTTTSAGSHDHNVDTATQAVATGPVTIRHVTATGTRSAGSHAHTAGAAGSHTHSVNVGSTTSSSDSHGHTVPARNTGPVSGGTPNVDDASAGTPDVAASDHLPPATVLLYIIYTGT